MMIRDPIIRAITTARVSLLLERPFFGNLATRLYLVDGSSSYETMRSDGHYLFYNRSFVQSLMPKELRNRIVMEVLQTTLDCVRLFRFEPHIQASPVPESDQPYVLSAETCRKVVLAAYSAASCSPIESVPCSLRTLLDPTFLIVEGAGEL